MTLDYGLPPWEMRGRVFTVWYRLQNPEEARRCIRPPLLLPDDPLCRVRFYDIVHNNGSGAAIFPFREAVIAIECGYGDLKGDSSVIMYADDPVYIAWGREVYGWPLKPGMITMTEISHHEPGVTVRGSLALQGTRWIHASVVLQESLPPAERPLPFWFGCKTIPSIDKAEPAVNQVVVAGPSRVTAGAVWRADGAFELGDDLRFLQPREIVSADYWSHVELTVGYGRVLENL